MSQKTLVFNVTTQLRIVADPLMSNCFCILEVSTPFKYLVTASICVF